MTDFDPALFLDAQSRVWDTVVAELSAGSKTTHWMWFVFPQLKCLGRSPTAKRYGLADLSAAAAYLAHPILRARIIEASTLLLLHTGRSPEAILGPVDALKLRSSMTLFAAAPNAPDVFVRVLDSFYDGTPCPLTRDALDRA